MLELFNDGNIYQTWSYGAVHWGATQLSHLVLKCNREVVAIAQLRIIRPTNLKFGMAYLRWGPLFERRERPVNPEILVQMAQALEGEYVEKRRLLLQIVPNAFTGSARADLFCTAFSKFQSEPLTPANLYRTFVLDLAPPIDQLRKKLDPKWRNKLTQSEKRGLKIISGTGPEEYRTFRMMYDQMKRRKGFETSIDVEEFARIQEDLPESHRMQILICEQDSVPMAGLVCSAMGDSAIYLLGATSDQGLNSRGAYLLQWAVIQWLKDRGVKWYDLCGIDPEINPGGYSFKKGLSGNDVLQIAPIFACESVVSRAFVKTGLAVRRSFQAARNGLQRSRSTKHAAAEAG